MRMIGNILWVILGGGIFLCIEYVAAGIALCATIIGIPFGIQSFKLAFLALLPFGRTISEPTASSGTLQFIMNLIWIVIGGIWIALTHLFFALLCAVTVIGIPFALQHWKLAKLALTPFGRDID